MTKKILKAQYEGKPLKIGDLEIPCAVLEDGTRVLSQRGLFKVLGMARPSGKKAQSDIVEKTPSFLAAKSLKPYIPSDLILAISNPIFFRPLRGAPAHGIEASMLPKICEVWLKARDAGALSNEAQRRTAQQADILMRGFAHVGIIALVDEATGYQEVRAKDALTKILEAYVSKELLPWTKRFPDEFYKLLFKMQGWAYNPMTVKRPSYVGTLTNDLIYDKLPPGVLEDLKKKTPKDSKGRYKTKFHQSLTLDVGNPHLEKQLQSVMMLMRISANKNEFMRLFHRAFPDHYPQMELPLPEDKLE